MAKDMDTSGFSAEVYQQPQQRARRSGGKKYEFFLACPQLRNSLHYLEIDDSEIDDFLATTKKHEIQIMKSPVGSAASITSSASSQVASEAGSSLASSQPRMLSTCSIGDIERQVTMIRSQESLDSQKRKIEEHEETKMQLAITLSELEKQK